MHMRVMTYNVHGWRTPWGQPNLTAVPRVIADSGADIVGLNEVFHPRVVEGSEGLPALQALAQALGFYFVFGPCMRWPATDTLPESSYGNALISRWPIIASAAHHLTPIDGLEQRGLLEGRILLPDGRTFTAYVTHLDYTDEANRLVQLRAVRSWTVRDRSRPHVVMGDFNAINLWDYAGRDDAFAALAAQPMSGSHGRRDQRFGQRWPPGDRPNGKGRLRGRLHPLRHARPDLLPALPRTHAHRLYLCQRSPGSPPHGCRILSEMAAYDASDHVPVLAEINY